MVKVLFWFGVLLVLIVANFAAWVRFAPTDPARWHVAPDVTGDADLQGGVKRRVEGAGPDALARFDAIARAAPRTQVLAGSVAEGMVTYVTRSALWGFPDYTTVRQAGDDLLVHGRLRFGSSDMGVNRARVDGWIAALREAR
ncbi:DUF1499 domain-containing protein [Rhodosalinus halophilus]|uniref:DUF1499 domain-containing protein n=1 Tax=Rhodosalinus halophilus TaxID=2259333 RepID=A0A365U4R5_9RHOB|nr:DUF1499 domain-containing protein [Rhodosalinus halophilus]RBI82930.1 DUF1499 domain-containing protein [Rhodosalinus halophilus]